MVQRLSAVPAESAWQNPTNPDTLQLRQVPQLAASQQKPSVHCLLLHSEFEPQANPTGLSWHVEPMQVYGATHSAEGPQGAPLPRCVHAPAMQALGITQSASLEQAEKQVAPLQR